MAENVAGTGASEHRGPCNAKAIFENSLTKCLTKEHGLGPTDTPTHSGFFSRWGTACALYADLANERRAL